MAVGLVTLTAPYLLMLLMTNERIALVCHQVGLIRIENRVSNWCDLQLLTSASEDLIRCHRGECLCGQLWVDFATGRKQRGIGNC